MATYTFNTRDLVQVASPPPRLAHLLGQRGVILYHAAYVDGIPNAEAIMIGATVVKTRKYKRTGQIDETVGGQIHVVPIECLVKVNSLGAELEADSVIA